jgi:cytochrome c
MRQRRTDARQQRHGERQTLWILALVIVLPGSAAHAAEGDTVRGERAFQRCYSCHSVEPNETAKLQGPSLFQIIGRPAAAVPGFEYSDAMREKAAAGLTWDAATLDRYIADPEGAVPGTLMTVPPLREVQERADLIAYLARSGRWSP